MPTTYDWNGTTSTPIKKIYDHDGTTATMIKKAYDWNGSSSELVYRAQRLINLGGLNVYANNWNRSGTRTGSTGWFYLDEGELISIPNMYHVEFNNAGFTAENLIDAQGTIRLINSRGYWVAQQHRNVPINGTQNQWEMADVHRVLQYRVPAGAAGNYYVYIWCHVGDHGDNTIYGSTYTAITGPATVEY